MNEAVDRGDGDSLIGEDLVPGAEGLVGRDGEASGLVAPGDQFEEHRALGLIFLGIGDVIEDDEIELVELGEGGLEGEVAAGGLKLLHDVGCAGVEDAPAGFDKGMPDGAQDVGLACARVADGDEVCAGLDPIPCGQRLDPGLGHPGQGLEVEDAKGFAAGQLRLLKVAMDAPGIPLGQFQFSQGREEAGGRPPLGIGAFRECLPMALEAWQTQRGEHGGQGVNIDGARCGGGGHARPSSSVSKLARSVSATGVSSGRDGSASPLFASSPEDKAGGFRQKIALHHQLADLGVQIFHVLL